MSRLRTSTGPFFDGGSGEWLRDSVTGGVEDCLVALKPEPGSRRVGGRDALVGVLTSPSSKSRSRSRTLAFLLSSLEGTTMSVGFFRVLSAFAFFAPLDITPFRSARGAPEAAPGLLDDDAGAGSSASDERKATCSQTGSDSGMRRSLKASRAWRERMRRSSEVRLGHTFGRTSVHDSSLSWYCALLSGSLFFAAGTSSATYWAHRKG